MAGDMEIEKIYSNTKVSGDMNGSCPRVVTGLESHQTCLKEQV